MGDTELGVRIISVGIGTALALSIYALARAAQLSEVGAFWAAVLFALSPLGWLSSFLAVTDGGFLLFWTLAATVFLQQREKPSYFLIGLLIACGALFKWPIYLLWFFFFWGPGSFREKGLGFLLSMIGLVPVVYWNSFHEWATFRHVATTIWKGAHEPGTSLSWMHGNFWDFFGAQALLFSPLFFLCFLIAAVNALRHWKSLIPSIRWCWAVSLASFGTIAFFSIFKKMQGNWVVFAYPTALVLVADYLVQKRKNLLIGGNLFSIGLVGGIFLITPFEKNAFFQKGAVSFKNNPFKHNIGWDRLAESLSNEADFLFADTYQMTSLMQFYHPQKEKTYFFNLRQGRKNQFSYWPGMEKEQMGKTGLFVIVESQPHLEERLYAKSEWYRQQLSPYFSRVEEPKLHTLFTSYGQPAKQVFVFRCINYKGELPEESRRY